VTKVLDDADKVKNKSNLPSDLDEFIPQRLVDFMEKAKVSSVTRGVYKKSPKIESTRFFKINA
jgi:hypothetical protein